MLYPIVSLVCLDAKDTYKKHLAFPPIMLKLVLIKLALVLETLEISQISVKIHRQTQILQTYHIAEVVFPVMMFFKVT